MLGTQPTGRANARPMTGSAKQSISPQRKSGLLRCARNDVDRVPHTTSFPRRDAPELCKNPSRPRRAWGMPDARCTRGLVCACGGRKHTSNNEHTGITRHSRCAQNAAASTASAPRVRDDRDTPLLWGGMREVLEVIWGAWEWKYFCEGDSTQNCPTGKSPRREPIPLVSRTRCSASTRRGHSSAAVKLSGPDVQIYLAAGAGYETNAYRIR